MNDRLLGAEFFDRPVLDVAQDLIGCTLQHGKTAGLIVETEAYHESEESCHAHVGRTPRSKVLFDGPGTVYVYRSYGIHLLVNLVAEKVDVGAAVLIRALEPTQGFKTMMQRRARENITELCSGPGKLTQALGITLEHNEENIDRGPIVVRASDQLTDRRDLVIGPRIGISKAVDLPWRFSLRGSRFVSLPKPK